MDDIQILLSQKQEELKNIIANTTRSMYANPVEGRLRIASRGKKPQYYIAENSGERYLKKTELELAKNVAQNCYDKKTLNIAQAQLMNIEKFLSKYNPEEISQTYEKYIDERKELVTPAIIPIDEYVKIWESETYGGLPMRENSPKYKTEKGENVRSKSEKIIADYFYHHEIPYKYEKPLYLKSMGTVHPDFVILNKKTRREYLYEHFGMMDDAEYAHNALRKMNIYSQNGYVQGENIFYTFESSKNPLETEMLERLAKVFL